MSGYKVGGETGAMGPQGKSAYQLAVEHGFVGTVEEWVLSLDGSPGPAGPPGEDGESIIGPSGPSGSPGTAASIAVGSVTTLNPGASATVNNSGTSSAAVLDFGIPRGQTGSSGGQGIQGNPGTAATVAVGSVSTLSPGASATVVNAGTSSAAVLNFGIPAGASGSPGSPGGTGPAGSAATIAVGTVTTLPVGSPATVTNVGTSAAAVLDIGLPTGATGAAGTSITKFKVTVAITPGLIALGTVAYTVTATGILATDSITVQPTSVLPAGLILAHWRVAGNNSVVITLGTPLTLGLNLGSSYNFDILAIR